nr:ATP-dependent RNA helicase A [Ipomoea batatas]
MEISVFSDAITAVTSTHTSKFLLNRHHGFTSNNVVSLSDDQQSLPSSASAFVQISAAFSPTDAVAPPPISAETRALLESLGYGKQSITFLAAAGEGDSFAAGTTKFHQLYLLRGYSLSAMAKPSIPILTSSALSAGRRAMGMHQSNTQTH